MENFARRLSFVASIAVLLMGLASVATPAMAGASTDTQFDFDIGGFNSTGTVGYYVVSPLQATFGSTQVFDGVGPEGQNITVSSSESVGATTITDTVIISTPTNFLTANTINGTTISDLQFDLGDGNAGSVGISLTSPVTSVTVSGYMLYNSGETLFSLNPANDSSSTTLAAAEGVLVGGGQPVSAINVNEFELSFTYANPAAVPEPASLGAFGAGLLGLLTVAQRRRFAR